MWAFVLKKRPQNDTIAHHFGNYYGSDDYVMYGIIYCIATAVHKQAQITEKDCGILHGTKTETEWLRFVRKIITIKKENFPPPFSETGKMNTERPVQQYFSPYAFNGG